MEPVRCPRCGSPKAVLGEVSSGHEYYPSLFVPRKCRQLRLAMGVGLAGAFHACGSCGLIWSAVAPRHLRAFVEEYGDEVARQQWDEFDRGPYRDLPDTDLGREIGAKVAEIDALERSGRPGVAGRYRELRGVTWDQALQETRNWSHLTREEKLALFGWVAKKKASFDDLDAPFL